MKYESTLQSNQKSTELLNDIEMTQTQLKKQETVEASRYAQSSARLFTIELSKVVVDAEKKEDLKQPLTQKDPSSSQSEPDDCLPICVIL